MPAFAKAEYADTARDIASYLAFARKLQVGQVVSIPLDADETPRQVMRWMNHAAARNELRLTRLPSDDSEVRFKVMPVERKHLNISRQKIVARTRKAMATRARHQAQQRQAVAA